MFLLNIDGSVNINFGHRRFTIQNVPIKLNTISYNASQSKNLQYKMFLLNEVSYEVAKNCDLFTIQNVPIKYFLIYI